MKIGAIISLVIFVLGAALALAQMWFEPMNGEIFFKLMITLGVVFVVVMGITLVRREYLSESELKKKGFID